MKICMVAYAFYDNDARVMRYAETLNQRGDEVDVIALRRANQPRHEVVNGVHVLRVQTRPSNRGGKLAYLAGVLLFLFRAMWLISRRHLKQRYELVHVHSVPDFLVFSAWLPRLTGAKLILDIHDLLPEFYASKYGVQQDSLIFRILMWVERMSGSFAHHVISANDLWQEKLVQRSFKEGKCTALVNVPDRAIFAPHGRTRNDRKFIILYPGTLNWHQGLDIAIRAFSRIAEAVPCAEFHIYGEGPAQMALAEMIKDLSLQNRVFMHDVLSTRDIAKVIENADLGVVPKRKDGFGNEAFSTKIAEFMAMGVPVIVPDTRVDRHYFSDSVVKFFRGGDEEDLACAMLTMICNAELRERLVHNALAFVEHHDWSEMKPKYLAVVDSLVHPQEAGLLCGVIFPPEAIAYLRHLHGLHFAATACIVLLMLVDAAGLCGLPVGQYLQRWTDS